MSFAVRPNWSVGSVVNPINVANCSDDQLTPTAASASITFTSSGTITYVGNLAPPTGSWFSPSSTGIGGSYWVRATVTGGTAPSSGTTGSWVSLSGGATWTNNQSALGIKTTTFTFEIASDSGGTTIVSSKTGIILRASVSS